MPNWDSLKEELDLWGEAGQRATFWWQDDDATAPTPALQKLIGLTHNLAIPVSLAVFPASATRGLRDLICDAALVQVLQHGYSHYNHAPEGQELAELRDHRDTREILAELTVGLRRLEELFAGAFVPVMVPPWHRISDAVTRELTSIGVKGISMMHAREARFPYVGLRRINVHVDVIDWRGRARFIGLDRALEQLLSHLRGRRFGSVDAAEPTGILTHHRTHDDDCWAFLEAAAERICSHPSACWVALDW